MLYCRKKHLWPQGWHCTRHLLSAAPPPAAPRRRRAVVVVLQDLVHALLAVWTVLVAGFPFLLEVLILFIVFNGPINIIGMHGTVPVSP